LPNQQALRRERRSKRSLQGSRYLKSRETSERAGGLLLIPFRILPDTSLSFLDDPTAERLPAMIGLMNLETAYALLEACKGVGTWNLRKEMKRKAACLLSTSGCVSYRLFLVYLSSLAIVALACYVPLE
jgi:hypothetical protein